MADILIGTSGFFYTDWIGPLYPEGTQKKDFLNIYASEFTMVELNFSYYRQPEAKTLERMILNTPEGFRFAIKAHQSLTHAVEEDISVASDIFIKGITPLVEASRLAAILFQFPYSFHYTPESRKHLDAVCTAFSGLPIAVEFRNNEWQKESVYRGLRNHNAAFVNVDEPRLPRLPVPADTVTSDMAYVRFHGRNKAAWWTGDNVSRYDYLYNKDELSNWIPLIEKMIQNARLLLIAFNNHSRGKAVQNARDLKQMLFFKD